jgi:hypothetical protein
VALKLYFLAAIAAMPVLEGKFHNLVLSVNASTGYQL